MDRQQSLMEQEGQYAAAHPVQVECSAKTFALAVYLLAQGHRLIRAKLGDTGRIVYVFNGAAQADKERYFAAREVMFLAEAQAKKQFSKALGLLGVQP